MGDALVQSSRHSIQSIDPFHSHIALPPSCCESLAQPDHLYQRYTTVGPSLRLLVNPSGPHSLTGTA